MKRERDGGCGQGEGDARRKEMVLEASKPAPDNICTCIHDIIFTHNTRGREQKMYIIIIIINIYIYYIYIRHFTLDRIIGYTTPVRFGGTSNVSLITSLSSSSLSVSFPANIPSFAAYFAGLESPVE